MGQREREEGRLRVQLVGKRSQERHGDASDCDQHRRGENYVREVTSAAHRMLRKGFGGSTSGSAEA
jgi:hypothetical protein